MQRAHNELQKDGIQVITVSIDAGGEAAVKPVFARGGYTMPAWIDTGMNAARGFGVRSVPYTVVVDRRGMITARGYGHVDYDGKPLRQYLRGLARP